MGCCDYCALGLVNFCNLCDTIEGRQLHWDYVHLWHLEGLFPCDYNSPTTEWIDKSQDWLDQMNQQTHQTVQIRIRP